MNNARDNQCRAKSCIGASYSTSFGVFRTLPAIIVLLFTMSNAIERKVKVRFIGDSITSTASGYCAFTDSVCELSAISDVLCCTSNNPQNLPLTNAMTSANTRSHIRDWLAGGADIVHINTGLWDLRYSHADSSVAALYRFNLEAIIDSISAVCTGAIVIWGLTTPIGIPLARKVRSAIVGTNDDIEKLNAVAIEVCTRRGAIINDLYRFSLENNLTYDGKEALHFDLSSRRAQWVWVCALVKTVISDLPVRTRAVVPLNLRAKISPALVVLPHRTYLIRSNPNRHSRYVSLLGRTGLYGTDR